MFPFPNSTKRLIIRLEPNEVAILLDQVEDGTKLTEKELVYHQKTKLRDVALLTLLLGTGIRVSECVGLNISDVDFETDGIKIRRKGGYEAVVYFGDEVETRCWIIWKNGNILFPNPVMRMLCFYLCKNAECLCVP